MSFTKAKTYPKPEACKDWELAELTGQLQRSIKSLEEIVQPQMGEILVGRFDSEMGIRLGILAFLRQELKACEEEERFRDHERWMGNLAF